MTKGESTSSGSRDQNPRENGRYLHPDDRDRYSTERVGYATGWEGFDVEPGWRSRSFGAETPRMDVPNRHYPPSGSYDHAGAPSTRSEAGRGTGGWYREPLAVVELMARDVKTV